MCVYTNRNKWHLVDNTTAVMHTAFAPEKKYSCVLFLCQKEDIL